MAKHNSWGFDFELLENRCLLNGSVFSSALLPDAPRDAMPVYAEMQPMRQAPRPMNADAFHPTRDGQNTGQFGNSQNILWGPVDSVTVVPVNQAPINQAAAMPYSVALAPAPQRPAVISVYVFGSANEGQSQSETFDPLLTHQYEASPTSGSNQTAKTPNGSGAGALLVPPQNASTILPAPPVKDSTNNAVQSRDLNSPPLSQTAGKGDTLPLQLTPIKGVALGSPGTQVIAQNGKDIQGTSAASAFIPMVSVGADAQVLLNETVPLTTPLVFDPNVPYAGLLSNFLPVDFEALDSSVQDFFQKIDRLGLKLSANHMDLLFSTGLMAAAAAVALEVGRRRIKAPVPSLAFQRADSIPYSD